MSRDSRRCPFAPGGSRTARPLHPAKHEAVRREVATLKNPDELRRENEVLRDRLSRLSAAVLRVSARLELNTVLQEVVESARALTGARCGATTTIDARGQACEFVSSGLTSEEHRQLAEWPDGPRLFEHLQELPAPLRLRDARAFHSVVEVDQFYGIEIRECLGSIAATAL